MNLQYRSSFLTIACMLAVDLIRPDFPTVQSSDTVGHALGLMEDFKLTHLPLVDGSEYKGLFSESFLLDNDEDDALGEFSNQLAKPALFRDQHLLDAFALMTNFKIGLIPVTTPDHLYIGSFGKSALIAAIGSISAVQQPGGIIILDMNPTDYSLTQIAQIIEGNDARILASYISVQPGGSNKIDLTLKINREDLSAIIQTFNRYNYTIRASFHASSEDEEIKRRYEQFMNYLNM